MKTKKRNPQDTTLRNVRALKKELKTLKAFVFFMNKNLLEAMRDIAVLKRVRKK